MTIHDWLLENTKVLEDAGIGTARLDCLVLLEDALNTNRTQLLADLTSVISADQAKTLSKLIGRRKTHEPLAYIREKIEFYGRKFFVNASVLVPRPETETMIELFKKLQLKKPVIADIGTGSGAIAITGALEIPNSTVYATDIDVKCLAVAQKNAKTHKAKIHFGQGNLLEPLEDIKIGIILANLPYVPDNFAINTAASNEPKLAIYGGEDGLDLYRHLFEQIDEKAVKPAYVLTESLPFQHKQLAEIAQKHGYKLERSDDFIQQYTRT